MSARERVNQTFKIKLSNLIYVRIHCTCLDLKIFHRSLIGAIYIVGRYVICTSLS